MTGGAAGERPHELTARWRGWCLLGAAVVALACLVPPLSGTASRFEYGEALQFSLLAIAVPALVALGAPWRSLGLARAAEGGTPHLADRVADRRLRHRELAWSLVFIALDLGAVVAWHVPGAVDRRFRARLADPAGGRGPAGVRPRPLARTRAVAPTGTPVGLPAQGCPGCIRHVDVLDPCLRPGTVQSRRSTGISYHVPGGLSAAADQQIASAVLWFVAAASFVPVIFWNAMMWLRTDEDPDAELLALERADRRRGTPPLTGRPGEGASDP